MEGQGPWQGDPVESNVLLAGYDLVTTDVVAVRLMGYTPEEIPLFRYAVQAGLGILDIATIKLVGDKYEDPRVEFKHNTGFDSWAERWAKDKRTP